MAAPSPYPPDPALAGPPVRQRDRRALRWWLAAGTFVVGVVLGGLIVGFAGLGSSSGTVVAGSGSAAPPVVPTPTGTAGGASGTVSVNDACLRAAGDAQQAYGAIGDLVSALRSLNPGRIDAIIQQLEPLQAQLQADSSACRVVTRLPDGTLSTGAPPAGTALPSVPRSS